MDVETIREMSQHTICAPGVASKMLEEYSQRFSSKFRNRFLPEADYTVLQRIPELAFELHDELKVYDVSRDLDRLRALKRGVLKTPAVIVQGEKHEGLDNILKLLP
jgi:hypothetical protein